MQRDVFMLIPIGMNYPISTADIRNILNLEERYVREIIEELITDYNIPIGSMREKNNSGYFIATNIVEKIKGTTSLEHQAMAMDRRVKNVRASDPITAYRYKELYKYNELDHDKQLDLLELAEINETTEKNESKTIN